ncbi:MAG: DUF1800 family protein [Lewinella sp.]
MLLNALAPYVPGPDNLWDKNKVKHLYRRVSYGADPATINSALLLSPADAVNGLMDEALAQQMSINPDWREWSEADFTDYEAENQVLTNELYRQVIDDVLYKGLRGRITLFWINHFVTELSVYHHSPYQFQYYEILFNFGFGNFKDLVRFIGVSNAMLVYLNGFDNRKSEPNENFARELLELFTLGVNNGYTEEDIVELSRALTGFTQRESIGAPIQFNPDDFDSDFKTIFGRRGLWSYNEAIDLIFEERGELMATFICEKLYRYFVSPAVDEAVVQEMATLFIASEFEMEPVLRTLFLSDHFFSEKVRGTLIKSPYDICCGLVAESGLEFGEENRTELLDTIQFMTAKMGQDFFNPIDVAGWQANRDWINSNSIADRWYLLENLLQKMWNYNTQQFAEFARELSGDSRDTAVVTSVVVDHFMPYPINLPVIYEEAESVLRWELPSNYYDEGNWSLGIDSAPFQVWLLIKYLYTLPEFQLR